MTSVGEESSAIACTETSTCPYPVALPRDDNSGGKQTAVLVCGCKQHWV
jgi:hypothetical protein